MEAGERHKVPLEIAAKGPQPIGPHRARREGRGGKHQLEEGELAAWIVGGAAEDPAVLGSRQYAAGVQGS